MRFPANITLNEDDFVVVGLNYNFFMIPRLAYPEVNLEKLKQQILDNQKLVAELKTIWNNDDDDDDGADEMFPEKILQIMEKYFGKRAR